MKKFIVRGTVFGGGMPKIAVPVCGQDESAVLSEVLNAENASDLIELRIDGFKEVFNADSVDFLLRKIRDIYTGPVLFTLRTSREGGNLACNDDEYEAVLTAAINTGCIDLIDIEAAFGKVAESLIIKAHSQGVRALLSQHDFEGTPDSDKIYDEFVHMREIGADVAKGAYMPREGKDVDAVLTAAFAAENHLEIPYILISMGEMGQMTRVYAESMGSCVTFASAEGKNSAPGQLDAAEMKKILKERHNKLKSKGSIFLIGFMGAGKSVTADMLGRMSGMRVLEMDRAIEEERHMSIPDIFARFGQPFFRDLETDLLKSMENEPPAIVSCGGGVVLRARNVLLMKNMGNIILLDVSPEEVIRRLAGEVDHRPNLKNCFSPEGIRRLQEARRESYRSAADRIIVTDGKSVEETAKKILGLYPNTSH